ncbi:hypothetical protein CR513_30089, partial [Mucuna pruriens]
MHACESSKRNNYISRSIYLSNINEFLPYAYTNAIFKLFEDELCDGPISISSVIDIKCETHFLSEDKKRSHKAEHGRKGRGEKRKEEWQADYSS